MNDAALEWVRVAGPGDLPEGRVKTLSIEHPSGEMSCVMTLGKDGQVETAALLRTARKLMDGVVFG